MITNKIMGIREVMMATVLALALVLAGVSTAFAQSPSPSPSPYTPPTGYSAYGSNGIFFNSSTGMYYNPMTGQSSMLVPLGPAARNINGSFIIPAGYSQYATTSYYFSPSSGYYYDPTTGFYSTSAPMFTGVTSQAAIAAGQGTGSGTGSTGGVYTPGVPNTGTGGDAGGTWALLALAAIALVSGAVYLGRRRV
jgi:hypothetical protein